MRLQHWKIRLLLGLVAIRAAEALSAPGTISPAFSPASPIAIGTTFTITLNISGYTNPTEIDGYNFRVTYPTNLFSLIGSSGTMHDNSSFGAAENWLRKPPQDGVGAGALPLTDSTLTSAGLVSISVVDLRGSSNRGTTAGSGFLYSFDLMAIAAGTGSITPAAALDGSVLFDVNLSTAGVPAFSGASMTILSPIPAPVLINPMINGGQFKFSFTTVSGRSYTAQYTDLLVPVNWKPLTNFTGGGGSATITDPATNQQRFYRVCVQ